MRSFAKAAKTSGLIISAAMCALGILLIAIPGFFTEMIGVIFGIAVIVFGCSKIFAYFSGDPFRVALRADLAGGIILIALGIILFAHPVGVMAFISIAAGIYMIADGVSRIQTAMQAKQLGYRRWWLMLAMAVLTGILGFVMMFRPGEGSEVLMIMLGISLLSDGILNLITIITASKYFKNIRSDMNIIDVDGEEK